MLAGGARSCPIGEFLFVSQIVLRQADFYDMRTPCTVIVDVCNLTLTYSEIEPH